MSSRDIGVNFRTRALAVLAASAAMLGLASCSTTNPGIPTPTTDGSSASTSTTSPQAVSDNWWKSVNACKLLDQSVATRLGFPQPGQIQEGSEQDCMWTASDGSVFGIVLDGQTYDSLLANMGQLSDLTIAGRPAKEDSKAGGSDHGCSIAVQATKGSRALIDVETLNTTVAQACSMAQTIGTAIAPKLPGGAK